MDRQKQDRLNGTAGQVVGFDADGNAVAQETQSLVGPKGDKGDPGLFYATCSTASSTTAKVAACTGFTLAAGAVVAVKFTNSNTASSPTLNVNGTGAKSIKKYGTTAPNTYMWAAGAVVEFVYDGTYWLMLNGTTATTTYYGVTKLNSSTASTSTTEAATPSAVKSAYDLAAAALSKNGGDVTGMIDMQNHVLTGLPSPTAPSDAVNYQTLLNAIAGMTSFAVIAISGLDLHGNTVTENAAAVLCSVGSYGTDTILYINTTIDSASFVSNMTVIKSVSVQFPAQFKIASSGWSEIANWSPMMNAGSNGVYAAMGPESHSSPLDYRTQGISWDIADIKISGYVKVGVNA